MVWKILLILFAMFVAFCLLVVYSAMVISSRCSRAEEERDRQIAEQRKREEKLAKDDSLMEVHIIR